ncbi:MAG: RNA polymerase sigma factor [Vulcanimicrobiota bacterium]
MKELNDAVTLCRKGNTAAYRQVVEKLGSQAVRYAYHFLGNYLDAEDAAQEAFIQAWRRLETLKEEHAFLQWFYRILAHIAQRKGKGVKNEESLEEHENSLEDKGSDPAALFETTERQQLIKTALQKLPPLYRSVLVLRDIEGFPYSEIARILEIPEGTVKSRLSAAREKLRSMLYDKEGKMIQCRAEMFRKN